MKNKRLLSAAAFFLAASFLSPRLGAAQERSSAFIMLGGAPARQSVCVAGRLLGLCSEAEEDYSFRPLSIGWRGPRRGFFKDSPSRLMRMARALGKGVTVAQVGAVRVRFKLSFRR